MAGGLNLYGYANGDPVNFRDPSGLAACFEGESVISCLGRDGLTVDEFNENYCEPWPECWFQEEADYWARRGGISGFFGLNLAAAGNGLSEAFGTNDLGAAAQDRDTFGVLVAGVGFLPIGKFGKFAKLGRHLDGGFATVDDALNGAIDWLGTGYSEMAPGVFRSADGLRQFRMTASDLAAGGRGPHVHFEVYAPGASTPIHNWHVYLTGN